MDEEKRLPPGPWDLEADRSVWRHAGLPLVAAGRAESPPPPDRGEND